MTKLEKLQEIIGDWPHQINQVKIAKVMWVGKQEINRRIKWHMEISDKYYQRILEAVDFILVEQKRIYQSIKK